jgi:serine/threonine protein kinase/tetratricopeptide (TPR) repeat protein
VERPTLPVRRGGRAGGADPDVEATFGAWHTVRRIAAGGFGTVYEARHTGTDARAALKLLHAKFATSAEMLARFQREVDIIQTLDHPAIVRLLDGGFAADGRPFFCMELLDGQSLSALIHARGRLPLSKVVSVMRPLCEALAVAHARNIVHRDVKAANVMLCGERVVLLDFGIAKISDAFAIELTATNQSLGTPTSMAPEQILGRVIDGRTDVYALGCLAYHAITGQVPFVDDSSDMLQHLHLHARRPRASQLTPVGADVDEVLIRAMAIDPAARFATPALFLEALVACAVANPTALAVTTPQQDPKPSPVETLPRQPRAPTAVLESGMRIAQYELERELGRGGMGVVYVARDVKLGRKVAMKFLSNSSREVADRFLIEARATARCSHDNIVIIHEVDEHDGRPYMVLEYLDGTDLRKVMVNEGRRLPPLRAIELALPIARALVRAHELGIIHRDLKPENVFVTTAGQVKVLDFGIAKAVEGDPTRTPPLGFVGDGMTLTGAGALIGTLPYIAPEQMHDSVDTRSDLWALGVILFELLAGEHPVQPLDRDTLFANLFGSEPVRSVTEVASETPAELVEIVAGCLAKSKEDRPSASEVVRRLEALLPTSASSQRTEPPPVPTTQNVRRPRWGLIAGLALGVVAIGIAIPLVLTRSSGRSETDDRRVAEMFRLAQRGEYVKATQLVEAYLKDHPDDPDVRTLQVLTKWWTTGALFEDDLEIAKRLPTRQRAMAQGIELLTKRKEVDAIGFLETADRDDPNTPELTYALGEAYWHGGKLERGVATLERAFQIDPRWQMALHHVLEFRLARGETAQVRPIVASLRSIDPAAAAAVDCRIAIAERRYADAAKGIAAAIASGLAHPETYTCQIHAELLADDYDAAERTVKVAGDRGEIDLREWGVISLEAELLLYRGQLDEYLEATRGKVTVQRSLALALWRDTDLEVTGYSIAGMRQSPIGMVSWILNSHRMPGIVTDEIYRDYAELEVSAFARGARAELRNDPDTAVAEYRKALATPAKGDVAMLASHHLARVLRQRGDAAGAKAACQDVLAPRVYQGYRALLVPDCRLWSEDPAQWKLLVASWRGGFEHPAVVEARKRLR